MFFDNTEKVRDSEVKIQCKVDNVNDTTITLNIFTFQNQIPVCIAKTMYYIVLLDIEK